jgi:hypothetical protein
LYSNFYFFPPTFLKELAGEELNLLIRNESNEGKKRQKEKTQARRASTGIKRNIFSYLRI